MTATPAVLHARSVAFNGNKNASEVTANITALARDGVILEHHYVHWREFTGSYISLLRFSHCVGFCRLQSNAAFFHFWTAAHPPPRVSLINPDRSHRLTCSTWRGLKPAVDLRSYYAGSYLVFPQMILTCATPGYLTNYTLRGMTATGMGRVTRATNR